MKSVYNLPFKPNLNEVKSRFKIFKPDKEDKTITNINTTQSFLNLNNTYTSNNLNSTSEFRKDNDI